MKRNAEIVENFLALINTSSKPVAIRKQEKFDLQESIKQLKEVFDEVDDILDDYDGQILFPPTGFAGFVVDCGKIFGQAELAFACRVTNLRLGVTLSDGLFLASMLSTSELLETPGKVIIIPILEPGKYKEGIHALFLMRKRSDNKLRLSTMRTIIQLRAFVGSAVVVGN